MSIKTVSKRANWISITIAAFLVLVAFSIFSILQDRGADASARASDFDPGRIIDDAVFYNNSSMTAGQIQSFLNSKVPSCDTQGAEPAWDWGRGDISRATLASYIRNGTHGYTKDTRFHAPPYTCMRDFKQDTPQVAAASGLCGSLSAKTNRTAAQIIKDVSNACGINPQVLLVLLNKEQSLVNDIWPLNHQYERATGFACPDNAGGACDPAYNGFFRQVYSAARQFKVYQAFPNNYNYIAGRTNFVYWHPDLSRCGGSNLYIQNQATAALYIYTPYQPNQSALNNYPGTGNSCSSYGNRNFWFMFNGWFGSSTSNNVTYDSLINPRWMKLKSDVPKYNLLSGLPEANLLTADTEIFFTTKTTINGVTYLRTELDSNRGSHRGIPLSSVENIVLDYSPMDRARWMSVKSTLSKQNPLTRELSNHQILAGTEVYFSTKIRIGGEWYLRTRLDTGRNSHMVIPEKHLANISMQYTPLGSTKHMQVVSPTSVKNPETEQVIAELEVGDLLELSSKAQVGGITYLRTEDDTDLNLQHGTPMSDLDDVDPVILYEPMVRPRWEQLTKTLQKVDLNTGENIGGVLASGRHIYFDQKTTIDGVKYLRTRIDTGRNSDSGIPYDDVANISLAYTDMSRPRVMQLATDTYKQDPLTEEAVGGLLRAGRKISFLTKVQIGGEWHLRTALDTDRSHDSVIPLRLLRDL